METRHHSSGYTTSITLISRLVESSDDEAWNRFVDTYSPLIFTWCQRFQLQDSDAADVTQEVLLKMVDLMHRNRYDKNRGGFRAWLKTITSNLIRDLLKSSNFKTVMNSTSIHQNMAQLVVTKNMDELAKLIEEEYEKELLTVASNRVKNKVHPQTWLAYYGTSVEMRPASEVASELDMQISMVYVGKSRVLKMLRKEIEQLDNGE